MRTGIYPPEMRLINLDSDWVYRRLAPTLVRAADTALRIARSTLRKWSLSAIKAVGAALKRHHGAEGVLARPWSTGGMVLLVALALASYLLFVYL